MGICKNFTRTYICYLYGCCRSCRPGCWVSRILADFRSVDAGRAAKRSRCCGGVGQSQDDRAVNQPVNCRTRRCRRLTLLKLPSPGAARLGSRPCPSGLRPCRRCGCKVGYRFSRSAAKHQPEAESYLAIWQIESIPLWLQLANRPYSASSCLYFNAVGPLEAQPKPPKTGVTCPIARYDSAVKILVGKGFSARLPGDDGHLRPSPSAGKRNATRPETSTCAA